MNTFVCRETHLHRERKKLMKERGRNIELEREQLRGRKVKVEVLNEKAKCNNSSLLSSYILRNGVHIGCVLILLRSNVI